MLLEMVGRRSFGGISAGREASAGIHAQNQVLPLQKVFSETFELEAGFSRLRLIGLY